MVRLNKHTINITQDIVQSLFLYDEELGVLLWRETRGGKLKGSIAGGVGTNGYHTVRINRILFKLHRIIWLYHYGEIPEILDHIDRNKDNNHIWNLRPCTVSENNANQNRRIDNTSGYKGVSLHKHSGLWVAKIQGETLGYFKTRELAAKKYKDEAKKIFGEFFNDTTKEETNEQTT